MSFSNFSSLPPEQEATFAVYEERIQNASKSGLMFGAIAGIGVGLLVIIISLTVTPKKSGDYSGDPGSQTQKAPANTVKAETAPTPDPTAPSQSPPAEAPPSGDTTAPSPSPTTP
jgi:hypothetical protein